MILILFLIKFASTSKAENGVIVNSSLSEGPLQKIWANTGFSPPGPGNESVDFLTSRDVQFNIALIGALPTKGIEYVRIHWLLDLVSIRTTDENSTVSYDFTHLDYVMDNINESGLKPIFELMGNPGGIFTDINTNATQIKLWKSLITATASRYIDRYGLEEVATWFFETWNEPDLLQYNILNFTIAGFLRYVKACREGLDDAVPLHSNATLRLGGPAGLFKAPEKHVLCWSFLYHCTQNPCGLSFLSFHKKGNGSAAKVVEESVGMSHIIKFMFGKEMPPPIANTEADIMTGWWRDEPWRADVRYAAAVTRVLAGALFELPNMMILSNDNGFLNFHPQYFTQRTLFARFQMNNTVDKHVQFIQKPVYSVMGMLSYLGNQKLKVSQPNDDRLKIIAGRRTCNGLPLEGAVVLIWASDDMAVNSTPVVQQITIYLPKMTGVYSVYSLENTRPHPAAVWSAAGSPSFPDVRLRNKMREAQGPHLVELMEFKNKLRLNIQLNVTMPSVNLVHVCQLVNDTKPGKVTELRALNVTFNDVLILWRDDQVNTRCILNYEVEFCSGHCTSGRFRRVNSYNTTFLSFQYTPACNQILQDT